MGLAPGQSLLHYTLAEQIGAGGMGVVFRATDSKLRCDVAIKVLPEDFARDAERLARFEREAQVLASLNHRGIAAIYGLEQHDEARFLVLELVPGDTLTDHLKCGPLPLEAACHAAVQSAEALAESHANEIRADGFGQPTPVFVHDDIDAVATDWSPDGQKRGVRTALKPRPDVITITIFVGCQQGLHAE